MDVHFVLIGVVCALSHARMASQEGAIRQAWADTWLWDCVESANLRLTVVNCRVGSARPGERTTWSLRRSASVVD